MVPASLPESSSSSDQVGSQALSYTPHPRTRKAEARPPAQPERERPPPSKAPSSNDFFPLFSLRNPAARALFLRRWRWKKGEWEPNCKAAGWGNPNSTSPENHTNPQPENPPAKASDFCSRHRSWRSRRRRRTLPWIHPGKPWLSRRAPPTTGPGARCPYA